MKRLNQIAPSQGATANGTNTRTAESPMLSVAQAASTARVTEAELDLTRAIVALQSLRADGMGKGRPIDVPLVGPYHTFYQQIFVNRPNARAFQIDKTMPLRVKSINDWVVTVHSASSAVHSAEQAHAQGTIDMRSVLACHDALREQRRKFLEAVYQYNCDIAEYAALAAPAGTTAEKFVGMLIPAKGPERIGALPGRPGLPQGAGGLRQLPVGQQQPQAAGGRQLPWGDGWVASSQPPQQLPPQQPSHGVTGDWSGSAGAGSGDQRGTGNAQGNAAWGSTPNGAAASSPNSSRQADQFAQPRYGSVGQ
jgi:hypothetical protein